MRHFKSKHFHFTWMLAAILAGGSIFYIDKHFDAEVKSLSSEFPLVNKSGLSQNPIPTENSSTPRGPAEEPEPAPTYPKTFSLKVPFTPQAPTANWDELHNEACEEASMIMSHAYFSGMTDVTLKPTFVEEEIAKLTEWEKQTYGYYLDLNAEETAHTLEQVYGLKTQVLQTYTENQLKDELLKGHLVLILANGKLLGNPNFRQPGPPYHMFVLRGWNSFGFVTNDPGTRKGMNYVYTYQTIYNAGGDWSHTINAVDQGTKAAIIVWKE